MPCTVRLTSAGFVAGESCCGHHEYRRAERHHHVRPQSGPVTVKLSLEAERTTHDGCDGEPVRSSSNRSPIEYGQHRARLSTPVQMFASPAVLTPAASLAKLILRDCGPNLLHPDGRPDTCRSSWRL